MSKVQGSGGCSSIKSNEYKASDDTANYKVMDTRTSEDTVQCNAYNAMEDAAQYKVKDTRPGGYSLIKRNGYNALQDTAQYRVKDTRSWRIQRKIRGKKES